MSALLAAVVAAVPVLSWTEGVETAPRLKGAGVAHIAVASGRAEEWRKAGFAVTEVSASDLAAREKLAPPGIVGQVNVASPTRTPWITANGWKLVRKPQGRYLYEAPAGKGSLAAAECYAYGADAVLKIDPADLEDVGGMLAFLASLPAIDLPPVADVAVVDDGSFAAGEVMNLLSRRNLLFRAVPKADSSVRVNVALGSKEYPRARANDPSALALEIRRRLGDEQRSLRIYGSDVVIARLAGDKARLRVDLLNYGGREVESVRIRVRGRYAPAEVPVAGVGGVAMEDYVLADDTTEFSIPRLGPYARAILSATP